MAKKNKIITASIPEELEHDISILQEAMSKKANVSISKSQVITMLLVMGMDYLQQNSKAPDKEEKEHGC